MRAPSFQYAPSQQAFKGNKFIFFGPVFHIVHHFRLHCYFDKNSVLVSFFFSLKANHVIVAQREVFRKSDFISLSLCFAPSNSPSLLNGIEISKAWRFFFSIPRPSKPFLMVGYCSINGRWWTILIILLTKRFWFLAHFFFFSFFLARYGNGMLTILPD